MESDHRIGTVIWKIWIILEDIFLKLDSFSELL